MGRFVELSESQLYELCETLLLKWLPQSSLFRNVAKLHLNTSLNQIVPGTFYAYEGNLEGDEVFLIAKQGKQNYYNAVSWSIFVPMTTTSSVTKDMFAAFEDIIDWTIPNQFYAVRKEILPEFNRMCEKHGARQDWGPEMVYVLEKKVVDAIDINKYIEQDKDLALNELCYEDVQKLVEHWEYGGEGCGSGVTEVFDASKLVGSAGITKNGELICWTFAGTNGAIHALFTIKDHRGKGYGKVLLQYLGKQLADKGLYATTLVEEHNVASAKLMIGAGFKASLLSRWVEFMPGTGQKWEKFLKIPQ